MLDPDAHVEPLVTLLGGGPLNFADLFAARAIAPCLVAADGGAQHAKTANLALDRIIGDMDSLGDSSHWQATGTKITHLPEQDSTDFEKCLYTLSADLIIGLGFLGGRLDHELAALSALAAYPARAVILIGPEDLVFLAPLTLALDLEPGARVSFFPLGPVTGLSSTGLKWPIKGLQFRPGGQIGTSNEAASQEITASFDARNMLVILPKRFLSAAVLALNIQYSSPPAPL